jgi:hypothetical protein
MYATLDTKNTTELYLKRKGWFSREMELTDIAYSYGKITYHRLSKRIATAITAPNTWIFKRAENSERYIPVTDEKGVIIGTATRDFFSRITTLSLHTGFVAKFYRPSIWSLHYIWESEAYGKIMDIDGSLFSLRKTINIDQSMAPVSLIPLLTFFGSYLVVLKKRRNTAILNGLLTGFLIRQPRMNR